MERCGHIGKRLTSPDFRPERRRFPHGKSFFLLRRGGQRRARRSRAADGLLLAVRRRRTPGAGPGDVRQGREPPQNDAGPDRGVARRWASRSSPRSPYALYLKAVPGLLFAPLGLPLAWCAATALLGKFHPKFVRPAKLLKLKVDSVPDEWRTLVVMPVLLSSPRRAEEICDQIEALSCLEPDENLQYLILGDFADGDAPHAPGDAEILEHTRQRVREINARAGRSRCFYLHRERQLLEADRRWMGARPEARRAVRPQPAAAGPARRRSGL